MKVKVLYDKYNTKIEKAILLFGNTPETEQSISLEVIEEDIGEGEEIALINKIKFTSIDSDSIEISNIMGKEDLRVIMSLLRNLLAQINN